MDAEAVLVVQVKFGFTGYVAKTNALLPRKQWLTNKKGGGRFLKEKHFVILSQHFDEAYFKRDLKVLFVFTHLGRGALVILAVHSKIVYCLSRNIW